MIGGPLEQLAKIVAVAVEGSAAVAGQKRDCCQFGRIDGEAGNWPVDSRGDGCQWVPPWGEGPNQARLPRLRALEGNHMV